VITGASSGIGRACALGLARPGFHVFAGVRRAIDGEPLRQEGAGRITPLILDVTDTATIAAAAEVVAGAVGAAGLAGLVNNAGIAVAGPLELIPVDKLRQQFEVNVIGQIAVTQALLPLLRRGRGRVVNMGSIAGRMSTPFLGPYAASKFALEALTDALRVELQPWGIHVAIIEPGAIATPIWEKSLDATMTMLKDLPPQTDELYGSAIAAVEAEARAMAHSGSAPALVVRAVRHALTSPRPRTRYLVGRDARIRAAVVRIIPDRFRDRLITRVMGLPGRGPRR
jgi:NAD(P)-dependent dehydrogenase (short-subunit alcohol dehydrogenase family)